jgi:hypothetical protein
MSLQIQFLKNVRQHVMKKILVMRLVVKFLMKTFKHPLRQAVFLFKLLNINFIFEFQDNVVEIYEVIYIFLLCS